MQNLGCCPRQQVNTPCCCLSHHWRLAICHMALLKYIYLLFATFMFCPAFTQTSTTSLPPRLQLALVGIKRSQAAASPQRTRLPITLQIMQKAKHLLSQKSSYDNTMLWAACCLAFFGFLRVSEFTVPTQHDYDASTHLSLSDISVDNRNNPQLIKVHIKQSKTDPFREGTDIYLGATNNSIFPISRLIPYLSIRGAQPGPLFITKDHRYLTRLLFSQKLDTLLDHLQINTQQYNTHSFQIGAATTAAQALIPDAHIKMLGRWRSDAYQQYIRTPPRQLAHLSKRLVSAPISQGGSSHATSSH